MRKLKGRGRTLIAPGLMLAWTLLAPHSSAFALSPSLEVSQYAHFAWTVRDGFSLGNVYAMAQTPDGYLWLGTEFGLFRFDGVRFLPWHPPAGQQLPDKNINRLLVTRDGSLWIGTFGGLVILRDSRLVRPPALHDQFVASLFEDREGTVWAASLERAGRLCAIRSDGATCSGEDGAFGRAVWAFYEDASGTLWAGAESGAWRLRPGPPRRYGTPTELIGLNRTEDGRLVMALHGAGLMQLAGDKVEAYPIRDAVNPDRLLADHEVNANKLLRDRDGGLWIGTVDRGLIHLRDGRADRFRRSDGLSGDVILSLFEDREGNVWVASTGGLDRFRELPVTTISMRQGLSSDATQAVLAATDGSIWVGAAGALTRLKHGQTTIFRKGSGVPDAPQSLYQDDRGRIWVSTRQGLAYFTDGKFVGVNGVPGGIVYYIAGDSAGNLWLSEQRNLLHLLNGRLVEQIPWSELGRHQPANNLLAEQGGVWLGFWADGSVSYLKDRQLRASYTAADGLGRPPVQHLQRDRDGAVWAATLNGLSRIKDGRAATLTTRNGLPCDGTNWTINDDEGSLWLYMRCGLVRITRTEVDAWIADPKRRIATTIWDAADGVRLRSSAASEYGPRVAKSADGKLWFVTGEGIQVVDPRHLVINETPPPVHIEQVTAHGRTYPVASDAGELVRLPPLVRDLQIDFTALSLVAPEKMHFRYKLEGFDDWQDVGTRRQAFYTNLQPGDYRFRVMASNNSGVWNEAGAALAFAILPAFYQTTWFRALYVAAFLALLGGVYKLRIRQVQLRWRREQQRRHLERLETEIAEARTFQQSLLPDREAFVNGLAICCRYMPCTGVGGDLYDYAAAKPGQTAVLIADVSGHGMSAAMLTGIVKSAFHASHVDGYEPLAVVQRVFSALAAFSPERFVTLFAALVAPDSCELRYVNAGHPPTLLWRGLRDFTWLESTGPLVSPALPASAWEVLVVPIDQRDQLLLYTDGVSDVLADADGGAETRIRTTVERDCAGGARLLDSILADVQHDLAGGAQPDDLTLLTVRLLPQ